MGTVKFLAFAALAQLTAATFAYADSPITITKIADTSTPDPSGSGDYTSFGIPSSDRDNSQYQNFGINNVYYYNNVYFTAQGPNGLSGVYQAYFPDSGVTEIFPIADTTMTSPTGGRYVSFSNTTSGSGEVGFIANDSNGVQGVYEDGVYGLYLVATTNTNPIAGTMFSSFQGVSAMSNGFPNYTPEGLVESTNGIFSFAPDPNSGFDFTLIANTSTIPAGASGPFTSFGPVSYRTARPGSNTPGYQSGELAMIATVGDVPGVYISLHAGFVPPSKLVDTSSTVPSGIGTFTSFGNPIATATYIEFTAGYSTPSGPQQGIFIYGEYLIGNNPPNFPLNPTLQELLASGTVAPDSDGAHFANFLAIGNNQTLHGDATIVNDNIPFLATLDDGAEGLFCTTGIGTSVKILDTGDTLDGQTVSSIELSPECAGGVFTVFEVGFADGSSGVFYFDTNVLPEPGALAVISAGVLPFIRRRR